MCRMDEYQVVTSLLDESDDGLSTLSEVEVNSSIDSSILDDKDGDSQMTCQSVLDVAKQMTTLVAGYDE